MRENTMAEPETLQPTSESFHELKNPDFNAGTFVMYLTTNPKGFEIQTDKSLPRKDFPLPLDLTQKKPT